MKLQNIFYAIILVQSSFAFITYNPQKTILMGTIQFPKDVTHAPTLSVLYNGGQYPIEINGTGHPQKGFFEIYESKLPKTLYLLITEHLKQPTSNEFKHLETSPDHAYLLYKLTKNKTVQTLAKNKSDETEKQPFWLIEKITSKEKSMVIPDNTIIFLMSPELIGSLEDETNQSNETLVRLPKIIFDDALKQAKLDETAVRMTCALVDFKFAHKKITKTVKQLANNHVASLPNSHNRYI